MQDIVSQPKPQKLKGLICRACGGQAFRVIYTRPAAGGRLIRRRECRYCGRRFTTWESTGCL